MKNISKQTLPYIFIIIVALCMLVPQIHSHAFVGGMDYYFHMSRTYETAMQIKTGHFSYFLSIFSWHHNARIVNALYGPAGGYISGLILLLAGNWYRWEISIFMIMLILAGGLMYHLCRYWHVERFISFLIGVLYMLSYPITNFLRLQEFSGFAASLVPLIVLMMSELLRDKDINPIKLALVVTLVIEVHLMTFVLSMIFVIPCVLLGIIVSDHKIRLIGHVTEAAVLTVLLSFNEWASIVEVFGSNFHHIIPTFPGQHVGELPTNSIMNTYPQMNLMQTPSLLGFYGALLIIVILILWIINLPRFNYIINTYMILGIVFIWLSSGWFPWTFISQHASAVSTLIQFPRRFMPIGLTLIYLTMGVVITNLVPRNFASLNLAWLSAVTVLMVFIGGIGFMDNTTFRYQIHIFHTSKVVGWANTHRTSKHDPKRLRRSLLVANPGLFLHMISNSVPDYLPTNVTYERPSQYSNEIKPYYNYNLFYLQRMQKIHFRWRPYNHDGEMITLTSPRTKMKTLPFAKYQHTEVILNHHQIKPHINKVGAMRLPLRAGRNQITLSYQPGRGFVIGIILSILSWLILIIYGFWKILRRFYIKYGPSIPL